MRFPALMTVLALSLGMTTAAFSAPASKCSDRTLQGAYGFAGTVLQNNWEPPEYSEMVGLFQFDGRGQGTFSYTSASSGGAVGGPISETLLYTVTPDCTFTFVRQNGETYSGVLVQGASEFFFIETTGGAFGTPIMMRGLAKKIGNGH